MLPAEKELALLATIGAQATHDSGLRMEWFRDHRAIDAILQKLEQAHLATIAPPKVLDDGSKVLRCTLTDEGRPKGKASDDFAESIGPRSLMHQ